MSLTEAVMLMLMDNKIVQEYYSIKMMMSLLDDNNG